MPVEKIAMPPKLVKPKRQLKVPERMKENGLLPESNTDSKLI